MARLLSARRTLIPQAESTSAPMARIVMKFGGTSMAGIERIRSVARSCASAGRAGNEVAVVVSAMAGETDRLVGFCREANPLYDPARIRRRRRQRASRSPAACWRSTLQAMGCKARSWLGWQLPIHTEGAHAKARIGDDRFRRADRGDAGGRGRGDPRLPGPRDDDRVTTLGRGGSDTSAVAIAAAVEGRPLRHLHRRRRGLYHRSADRRRARAS